MNSSYKLKTKPEYESYNYYQIGNQSIQQKSFSSFSMETGKIKRFHPKPTPLFRKFSKMTEKSQVESEDQFRFKFNSIQKPQNHVKYFDKLQISCKLPSRKNRELRISEATTSPNIFGTSRQREEIEDVKSVDWNDIRKSPPTNFMSRFMITCNPQMNTSINFCTCNHPCKWGIQWKQWAVPAVPFVYKKLRKQALKPDVKIQIQKDLKRTQPQNLSFQVEHNLQKLRQVLQMYAKYDSQLQYVQGMNLITSSILYHVKTPEATFFILQSLMEKQNLREMYINKFQKVFNHTKIIKRLIYLNINDLYNYFQQLQLDIDTIMIGWVLSLMLKVVPLQYSHLVLDGFMKQGFLIIYKLILTYLVYLKEDLFIRNDSSDVLHRLSPSFQKGKEQNWEQICLTAKSFKINEEDIKQISRSLKF